MDKDYVLTRKQAADILKVSTRTIDRYIKSGKLSYKKIGNKVFLSRQEVENFDPYFKEISYKGEEISIKGGGKDSLSEYNGGDFVKIVEEKLDKIYSVIKEKDKLIEEKNKIILMLQNRIVELEKKIENMIALPDYTKEKERLEEEKNNLEKKLLLLQQSVKNEKSKNIIFLAIAVILMLLTIFLYFN